MKLLVSACLLGVLCRYDGKAKTHEGVCSLLEKHTMIPFCPEIYGGLSTPRPASERLGERVVAKTGGEVTECNTGDLRSYSKNGITGKSNKHTRFIAKYFIDSE